MAKIYCGILGILLLCSCNRNRVPTPSVESGFEQTIIERTEAVQDSIRDIKALEDIPVWVDTTFADTAVINPPAVIIIKTIQANKPPVVKIIKKPTLQEIYSSYIGVRELTGKNDGPQVEKFLKTVGLGKGYPWCAAFVKYCLLEAGVSSAISINGMALSTENKKHFVYRARGQIEPPRTGDVGTLYYASLKRIGHTFFYDKKVNASVYESVEGNTDDAGSREGGGVYRKKRSLNATHSISRWE